MGFHNCISTSLRGLGWSLGGHPYGQSSALAEIQVRRQGKRLYKSEGSTKRSFMHSTSFISRVLGIQAQQQAATPARPPWGVDQTPGRRGQFK
jgi:hypothetical protein